MENIANSSEGYTMKKKHPVHFRSMVPLLKDTHYYQFQETFANAGFKIQRMTPLRTIMNHPYTRGRLTPSSMWEAGCTLRPPIRTVYFGTPLFWTFIGNHSLFYLSVDPNTPVCLFQLETMWASLLN